MSLTAITRDTLQAVLREEELIGLFGDLEAGTIPAAGLSQIDSIILQVCDRVVLAVNSSGQYRSIRTGKAKVPPELVHAAHVLCRHACISKAPGDSLSSTLKGGTRSDEHNDAESLLQSLEQGDLFLADYTIGADEEDLVPEDEETGGIAWGAETPQDIDALFTHRRA